MRLTGLVALNFCGGVLVVACLMHLPAAHAGPTPPLPCSAPPQVAAVAFFEFIEAPRSEPMIRDRARDMFSKTLLDRESQARVLQLVESAKQTYGFDRFERPLSQRLSGEPRITETGRSSTPDMISVRIIALSSRGKIEQKVSMRCEERFWKVTGFSYGPAQF